MSSLQTLTERLQGKNLFLDFCTTSNESFPLAVTYGAISKKQVTSYKQSSPLACCTVSVMLRQLPLFAYLQVSLERKLASLLSLMRMLIAELTCLLRVDCWATRSCPGFCRSGQFVLGVLVCLRVLYSFPLMLVFQKLGADGFSSLEIKGASQREVNHGYSFTFYLEVRGVQSLKYLIFPNTAEISACCQNIEQVDSKGIHKTDV